MQPVYHENSPIWNNSNLNVSILTGLLEYTKGVEFSKNVNGWEVIGERTLLHTTCTKAFAQAFTHNKTESVICFWQETPVEPLFNKSEFKVDTYLPSQKVIDEFVNKIIINLKRTIHAVGYDLGGTIAQVVGCRYGFPSLSLDGPGIKGLPLRIDLEAQMGETYKTMIVMPHVINQIDLPENSLLFFRHSKLFTIEYKQIENCLISIGEGVDDVPTIGNLKQYADYLAKHTATFHSFSIFETGQIDKSLVEKMVPLSKKMNISSHSSIPKEAVIKSLAGGSLTLALAPCMPTNPQVSSSASESKTSLPSISSTSLATAPSRSSWLARGSIKSTGIVAQSMSRSIPYMAPPVMEIAQNIFKQGLTQGIDAFNTPSIPFFLAELKPLTMKIYQNRRIEEEEVKSADDGSSKQERE